MQVRDNVRERRRNRIQQLTGTRSESWRSAPAEEPAEWQDRWASINGRRPEERDETIVASPNLIPDSGAAARPEPKAETTPSEDSLAPLNRWFEAAAPPTESNPDRRPQGLAPMESVEEPDPEKWWKERQRLQFSNRPPEGRESPFPPGTGPIKRLSDFPSLASGGAGWNEGPSNTRSGSALGRFLRSFVLRIAIALLMLGGAWAWFHWELPGSEEAQAWTVQTLTQDMDYVAVQEWYEKMFGSTPAFLQLLNRSDNSTAVTADWSREDIAAPLDGEIVKSFAQDGTGIRMNAPAGTSIRAVHTGRVTQVTRDDQGMATILIQHPNRVISVYGNVDNATVKANDWVETGTELGEAAPSLTNDSGEGVFYFALKQNGRSLNPSEVIPFD